MIPSLDLDQRQMIGPTTVCLLYSSKKEEEL